MNSKKPTINIIKFEGSMDPDELANIRIIATTIITRNFITFLITHMYLLMINCNIMNYYQQFKTNRKSYKIGLDQ